MGPQKIKAFRRPHMIVNFRFSVEMKAKIKYAHQAGVSRELSERVRRLVQKVATDKEKMIEVYKISFLDLLQGDYYNNVLHRKIKTIKEEEIILPVAAEMDKKDLDFFESLFEVPLDESLGETKDKALNHFFSQFKNPAITSVQLTCTKVETESEDKGKVKP
jgi:hypothetical protein